MEESIANYIEHLFNLKKKGVTIIDTENYIEKWDLNIDELILHFKKHIDLNKLFNLPDSSSFYRGHKTREKYELLIQFFTILHNYSKNLLLDFGLYSQKTIQDDNANIRDCLVFIPEYTNYLSFFLGYLYDKNKREWIIDDEELTYERQMELGKFCVICGYGRHTLNKLMETKSTEDDEQQNLDETLIDNIEEKTPEIRCWTCEKCSLINESSNDICVACLANKPVSSSILLQNMLGNTKSVNNINSEISEWECKKCTFKNKDSDHFCDACNENRPGFDNNVPQTIINKKLKTLDNPKSINHMNLKGTTSESNKLIIKKQVSNNANITDSNDETLTASSLPNKKMKGNELKYEDRTFINDNSETKTSESNKLSTKRERANNYKRSDSNDETLMASSLPIKKIKVNQWECGACTFINDNSEDFCKICLTGKPTSNSIESPTRNDDKSKQKKPKINYMYQISPTEKFTHPSLSTETVKTNELDTHEIKSGSNYIIPPTSDPKKQDAKINDSLKGKHIDIKIPQLNSGSPTNTSQYNDKSKLQEYLSIRNNYGKCKQCSQSCRNSASICDRCQMNTLERRNTLQVQSVKMIKSHPVDMKRSSSHHDVVRIEEKSPLTKNSSESESVPRRSNNDVIIKDPKLRTTNKYIKPNETTPKTNFGETNPPPPPQRPQHFGNQPPNKPLNEEPKDIFNKMGSSIKSTNPGKKSASHSPEHSSSTSKSINQGQKMSPSSPCVIDNRQRCNQSNIKQPKSPSKGKEVDRSVLIEPDRSLACTKCGEPLSQSNKRMKSNNKCKKCRPKSKWKFGNWLACGKPEND